MMEELTKEEAAKFFGELYYGEHHIPNYFKQRGSGWAVSHVNDLATFDFNALTRLVFMAHRDCIRVSIAPHTNQAVLIVIHRRDKNAVSATQRHPTIEQALELFNQ